MAEVLTSTSGAATQKQAGMLQIGSGLTSLMSGIASFSAASIQARQFKIQGAFDQLAASQEKLKAREQAVFLRKKFLANISSANASFAARRVSTGSGGARQFAIQSLRTLGEDIQATELSSQAAQNTLQLRASQSNLAASAARNLGLVRSMSPLQKGTSNLLTGFKNVREANVRLKTEVKDG
jgi:hypothetical protein